MRAPEPKFAVDTDEFQSVLARLGDVGVALAVVRGHLRDVVADAPRWAADGDLPGALAALIDVLDAAARRSESATAELVDGLRSAGRSYADADHAAVASRVPATGPLRRF